VTASSIEPELWVDHAGEAVAFYAAAFGASVLMRVGTGDDIVARLEIGAARFWVAAASAPMARFSPEAIGGRTSRTLLVVEDPDELVDRAVGAGATLTAAVGEEHGWRMGRMVDPYGHEWEIGAPLG
jgi:PhnB protein